MTGLSKPPERQAPSRAVGRILFFLTLAIGAGVVIYSAVVNQRIDLVETRRTEALDLANTSEVSDLTVNVDIGEGGGSPVVLLHDADVTGGLLLADVAAALPEGSLAARVDMPGFGLSDRMPFETHAYTAAGMAELLVEVIEDQFSTRVIVVGVGFGGEVAAEIAHTYPDVVSGVVLVDVDFWSRANATEFVQRVPWVGTAATYTWETGGSLATDEWQPYCGNGGWCASSQNLADRAFYVTIAGSTDSINEYHRTHDAAEAPANLEEITVPVAYVWSVEGPVSEATVDRIVDELPGVVVVESASFQAHLEDPASVAQAVAALAG